MREQGLRGRVVKVTRRQPGLKRFLASGENLIRNAPPLERPNQQWVADITFLQVKQRRVYLAVVMDVFTRRILAWSLADHRTTTLTIGVLRQALKKAPPEDELIFHTDRGIEYAAFRFRNLLKKHGIKQSMNRPGRCTDNAYMESCFHTLKAELIRGRDFRSVMELRKALASYMNHFYNQNRLHSSLGYRSPLDFERLVT